MKAIVIGVVIVLAVLAVILWPRTPVTPEEVIRQKVVQIKAAVREEDLGFILDQFSDGFAGTNGMSKDDLRRMLAAQFIRGELFRMEIVNTPEVTLSSSSEAQMTTRLLLYRADSKAPAEIPASSHIGLFDIDAKLQRNADGDWQFVSGSYKRLPPGTLF